MDSSICGANCAECPSKEACVGCRETSGCPFGKQCSIAKYILTNGSDSYRAFKNELIAEINALDIVGMENVTELYPLVGSFINLEYPLPNGSSAKFLCDDEMYLGTQVKGASCESGSECFGAIACAEFLLICKYGEGCIDPQLVLFKKR